MSNNRKIESTRFAWPVRTAWFVSVFGSLAAISALVAPASGQMTSGSEAGDPIVLLDRELVAGDGAAEDGLGYAVAIDRTTAVVGAPYAMIRGNEVQGAAYVFRYVNGSWTEVQKLTADDGAAYDQFGSAVAVSGDRVIVGAPDAAVNGNLAQGAAYVFVRSGDSWSQTQKLVAADGTGSSEFGSSVAVQNSTALIGAVQLLHGPGAAYVFNSSGGAWTQSQELTAKEGSGTFGDSVALDGDTALIGAQQTDVNGAFDQGAAFIFVNTSGTWTEQAELVAKDGAHFDSLGCSVALSGNTALVGAAGAALDGRQKGAAYIFTEDNGQWSQSQKLIAKDGHYLDGFGSSVALSGPRALIGADEYYSDGPGKVYPFIDVDGTWTERKELRAADSAPDAEFGWSVALDDKTILIGAWGADVNGNSGQGAAYLGRFPARSEEEPVVMDVVDKSNAALSLGYN